MYAILYFLFTGFIAIIFVIAAFKLVAHVFRYLRGN
jgi:hypothetical protein